VSKPSDFLSMGAVTSIGCLPHTDPQAALQLIAQLCSEVPFWPQLPRLCLREQMIEQALGASWRFFVPHEIGYGYRLKSGQRQICLDELSREDVALDEHVAIGFFAFEHAINAGIFRQARALKGQLVGPMTLACQLFDREEAFVFNEHSLTAVSRYITRLALWQMQRLQRWNLPVICFLDEPCLALLAHDPFQHLAGQVVQMLRDVVATLQAANVLVGIHCCAGQPPFRAMCQAAPDILSFDAYQDLETFSADASVRRFIDSGGLVASGLVPTFSDLSDLDAAMLFTRWLLACKDISDIRQIASRTLITATCGLGLLSLSQATSTFVHAQRIAMLIKKVLSNIF
jgi:methionine synthase II (cobalamin-independent)